MLRVRDAMTREVSTLGPEASAGEALVLCRERNIRHIPIVQAGRLIGVVSDRDLRDVSPPRGASDEENAMAWVRVGDMMTADVRTSHPLDTIEHAARELEGHKIGCLPVVADGELVGIITSSDLMRVLVQLVGAHGPGTWIEVEVPNEPGTLAGIVDVIRDRKVNIGGIFLTAAGRATNRIIVIRLETMDSAGVVANLEEAGYDVTVTESTASVDPDQERR